MKRVFVKRINELAFQSWNNAHNRTQTGKSIRKMDTGFHPTKTGCPSLLPDQLSRIFAFTLLRTVCKISSCLLCGSNFLFQLIYVIVRQHFVAGIVYQAFAVGFCVWRAGCIRHDSHLVEMAVSPWFSKNGLSILPFAVSEMAAFSSTLIVLELLQTFTECIFDRYKCMNGIVTDLIKKGK